MTCSWRVNISAEMGGDTCFLKNKSQQSHCYIQYSKCKILACIAMTGARHNFEGLSDSLIKYLSQFWLEANSFSLNSCSDSRKKEKKNAKNRTAVCVVDMHDLFPRR